MVVVACRLTGNSEVRCSGRGELAVTLNVFRGGRPYWGSSESMFPGLLFLRDNPLKSNGKLPDCSSTSNAGYRSECAAMLTSLLMMVQWWSLGLCKYHVVAI